MKRLYWIDDNIKKMLYIMNGSFMHFWNINESDENKIKTKIIILGNDCYGAITEKCRTKKDEAEIQEEMERFLMMNCENQESIDWSLALELYKQNKVLVEEGAHVVFKQVGDEVEPKELYEEFCKMWTKPIKDMDEERAKNAKALIEEMNIEDGAVVGIDLALFQKDSDNIKEGKILSMELFEQLSRKCNCFLYSTYMSDNNFIETWRNNYKTLYNKQNEPTIFNRKQFMEKADSRETINKIIQMFE